MNALRTTFALAAAAALSLPLLSPAPAEAATWELDAAHSHIGFKVRHLAVSWVRGDFGEATATIEYDGKDPRSLKADVSIAVSSVDTENEKRDEHLRSADFFDASEHPTMTFESKKVKNVSKDGSSFQLVGDLTLRGVTKEVTLDVEDFTSGTVDPWGNVKAGASASTTIDRKEFGLTWDNTLDGGGLVVGDDVKIELELEFNQKK